MVVVNKREYFKTFDYVQYYDTFCLRKALTLIVSIQKSILYNLELSDQSQGQMTLHNISL